LAGPIERHVSDRSCSAVTSLSTAKALVFGLAGAGDVRACATSR